MTQNKIIFKGTTKGVSIYIDESLDFETLKSILADKIKDSKKFFSGAKAAIILKGRKFTDSEEDEIVKILIDNINMEIEYVTTEDFLRFRDVVKEEKNSKKDYSNTMYYHSSLRSGQTLKHDGSIVIVGDVNHGGEVIAGGSITVMGKMLGKAEAGVKIKDSYIIGADMNLMKLKIGDVAGAERDVLDDGLKGYYKAYVGDSRIVTTFIDGSFNC